MQSLKIENLFDIPLFILALLGLEGSQYYSRGATKYGSLYLNIYDGW
jgi:hypothetical protein